MIEIPIVPIHFCLGTPQPHLEILREIATTRSGLADWTINTKAQPGDLALFYLKNPISAIVAYGFVRTHPTKETDRQSPWFGYYLSDIQNVRMLSREVPLCSTSKCFSVLGVPLHAAPKRCRAIASPSPICSTAED